LRNHIYKTHMGLTSSQDEEKESDNQSLKKTEDEQNVSEEQDPLADPLDITQDTASTENSETNIDLEKKNENDEEVNKMISKSPKIQTTVTEENSTAESVNEVDMECEAGKDLRTDERKNREIMDIDGTKIEDKPTSDEKMDTEENDSESINNKEDESTNKLDSSDIIKVETMDATKDINEEAKETNQAIKSNENETKIESEVSGNKNNSSVDDEIVIINEEPKTCLPTKNLSDKEKKLIEKMLHMLKKYGCAFCANRFDTKYALSSHERTHLKNKKTPKKEPKILPKPQSTLENPDSTTESPNAGPTTPKLKKSTKMGSVQIHDNFSGPVCFKCSAVCKDNSNYKNHILSHYYREFDPHIPQVKPFECPICTKPSRDKITLIRHYAFTHQKMFELTDITPEQLVPAGGGIPKTPKPKPRKIVNDSGSEISPTLVSESLPRVNTPPATESNVSREATCEVTPNAAENNELDHKDNKAEETVIHQEEEECPIKEDTGTHTEENVTDNESSTKADQIPHEMIKISEDQAETIGDKENIDEKEVEETETKIDNLKKDLSENKENEEEIM